MKKQSELKKHTTSLRLTEEQFKIIEMNAKSRNLNISEYIISCSVHPECGLTPDVMVCLENLKNEMLQIARSYNAPFSSKIQEEVNRLWLRLK